LISRETIRIGAGAGYSGDRIEPALELAEKGALHYLVFECLAERTIALAQQQKAKDPDTGYDPMLEERLKAILPLCHRNKVKIITNMGAANPIAAMHLSAKIARELGLDSHKIAAVTGDDVLQAIKGGVYNLMESGDPLSSLGGSIISANAYLGAAPLVEALKSGADVVITGRVADPVLFTAPLIYEFNWAVNDFSLMGQGIVLGHLMECAGHLSGGYFADPGYKEVRDLHRLGFPIAEVAADGSFTITKLKDSGGLVNAATCKEQLLYEIHDPANYLTPDVIADFTGVTVTEKAKDVVRIEGGRGKEKSSKLKVSVGYADGYTGEGCISYGGPGAVNRGKLAIEILKKRFQLLNTKFREVRYDLIGLNSLYGDRLSKGEPTEVRVRVAGSTEDRETAAQIGKEVETLYTNGPSGGGGVSKSVQEVVAVQSILIDEALASPKVFYTTI
jgi:hypothetical protein